jgi:hypothetical protein
MPTVKTPWLKQLMSQAMKRPDSQAARRSRLPCFIRQRPAGNFTPSPCKGGPGARYIRKLLFNGSILLSQPLAVLCCRLFLQPLALLPSSCNLHVLLMWCCSLPVDCSVLPSSRSLHLCRPLLAMQPLWCCHLHTSFLDAVLFSQPSSVLFMQPSSMFPLNT